MFKMDMSAAGAIGPIATPRGRSHRFGYLWDWSPAPINYCSGGRTQELDEEELCTKIVPTTPEGPGAVREPAARASDGR
jgi:hypothetical protein